MLTREIPVNLVNFPEKDGMCRPGYIWEITGNVLFSPVRENGEGDRFFGVAVESDGVGGGKGALGKIVLKS